VRLLKPQGIDTAYRERLQALPYKEGKMNLPANISVSRASLPRTYQAAQAALAECSQVDECKDWADKAAALASYARQSEDQELERMAQRIRARAIRRAGELLKQLEPNPGGRPSKTSDASDRGFYRSDAARDAGMSERQQKTAIGVANVPDQEFERQVESDKPPTLSQLAAQGTKPRENIIDLKGRDPQEYNRALHYVADFEEAAKELEQQKHDMILPTLDEKERARLRAAINRIDTITDKVATRI